MKKIKLSLLSLIYFGANLAFASSIANTTPTQANKTDKITQTKPITEAQLADILHWITNTTSNNLCNGSFKTPQVLINHPNPPATNSQNMEIYADKVDLQPKGISVFTGHVELDQPNKSNAARIIKSQKAIIKRDAKRRIQTITLPKTVSDEDANKFLIADSGIIHAVSKEENFQQAKYHIKMQPSTHSPSPPTYWGTAAQYQKLANGDIKLIDATCSTCNPIKPSWSMHVKRMTMHKKSKYAEAHQMVLYFHKTPVFYWPYIIFPTDTSRHTGALFPSLSYKKDKGLTYQQPVYLNLAPNYDATITPGIYSKNGIRLDTLFRYLTPKTSGHVYVSLFPKDKGFIRYKNKINQQGITGKDDYLKELNQASNTRGYISWLSDFNITPMLKGNINLNYVTDPYYLRDYKVKDVIAQSNQLENSVNLTYNTPHWQFYNTFQAFQTLHRIDTSATADQYQRLPELDFNGNYDHILGALSFDLDGQYVNFDYHSKFTPKSKDKAIGGRLHLQPSISAKFASAYGYITPSISLDATGYRSQLAANSSGNRAEFNQERAIPIAAIDSGLYFEKDLKLAHNNYWQTLEPRLKYTYIPYKNQDAFPNFDTSTPSFNYSSLFSDNEFSSFDRLQNTSQISLGVSSRLLQQKNAAQIFEADAGFAYYMTKQKVCLTAGCAAQKPHFSPLFTQISFNPNSHFTLTSAAAWDVKKHYIDNASTSLEYTGANQKLLDLSYIETHNSSKLITLGAATPLSKNLSALGYVKYNIIDKRPESYLAGLQYDTCCWTTQLVVDQEYAGIDPKSSANNPQSIYNRGIYFQFMLKGLGSFGHGNAASLLSSDLPNFSNPFNQST